MATFSGRLSRIVNRYTGGVPGQTLCARVADTFGADCLFCRLVARFTEPDHCAVELDLHRRRLPRD